MKYCLIVNTEEQVVVKENQRIVYKERENGGAYIVNGSSIIRELFIVSCPDRIAWNVKSSTIQYRYVEKDLNGNIKREENLSQIHNHGQNEAATDRTISGTVEYNGLTAPYDFLQLANDNLIYETAVTGTEIAFYHLGLKNIQVVNAENYDEKVGNKGIPLAICVATPEEGQRVGHDDTCDFARFMSVESMSTSNFISEEGNSYPTMYFWGTNVNNEPIFDGNKHSNVTNTSIGYGYNANKISSSYYDIDTLLITDFSKSTPNNGDFLCFNLTFPSKISGETTYSIGNIREYDGEKLYYYQNDWIHGGSRKMAISVFPQEVSNELSPLYESTNSLGKYVTLKNDTVVQNYDFENDLMYYMDGKERTEYLVNKQNGQDLNTATTIECSASTSTIIYTPAASACYIHETSGTERGNWYLPSISEIAFVNLRVKTIQDKLSKVSVLDDKSGAIERDIVSSNETYDSNLGAHALDINVLIGDCGLEDKNLQTDFIDKKQYDISPIVRPFIHLKYDDSKKCWIPVSKVVLKNS